MKKSKFVKHIKPKESYDHLHFNIQQKNLQFKQLATISLSQIQNTKVVQKQSLPEFTVVSVQRKQFIIIFHPKLNVLGFIDQHALHQRVRYQYYLKQLQRHQIQSFIKRGIQKKMDGKIMQVMGHSHNKLVFIEQNALWPKEIEQNLISMWGFYIQRFSHGIYMVKCPNIFQRQLQPDTIRQIGKQILELVCKKSQYIPRTLDHIIGQKACKSAIKFGDQVSLEWCDILLHNASICDFPWSCVHGRPTVYFKEMMSAKQSLYTLI